MKKREYILEYDMTLINIISVVILAIVVLLTIAICLLIPGNYNFQDFVEKTLIGAEEYGLLSNFTFIIVMFLWMILHEIIHGVAYELMGAKRQDIVFGANIENGVFYCKCKEYIKKKCILTSLLSPFILIGVVTYIIGFIIKSPLLIILSIVNISGAAGDLVMTSFFLHQKDDIEFKEMGFSSPFCIRTREDISKKKYLGIKNIKVVENEEETKEGPEKKVTISKGSKIFFAIILVILILDIISTILA